MKPSIPIAVTTGSLYPLPTIQSIQQLNELGLQQVELTIQPNELSLTFERSLSMPIFPDLLDRVQAGQLHVRSIHAPAISAERCYNMWARLKYLAHSIEICHRLGGKLVVIHPFHLFQTHESALEYLAGDGTSLHASLLPGIEGVLEQAKSADIMLALENIQDWQDEVFFNAPQNMSRFLRDMDHPSLEFTFDLMHAQVSGSLEAFASTLATHIVNIHASDLLPPTKRVSIGKGIIDWKRLAPMLQNLPNLRQVTVELSNPQPGEILESIAFLSKLVT